jgi:hypothetical protein
MYEFDVKYKINKKVILADSSSVFSGLGLSILGLALGLGLEGKGLGLVCWGLEYKSDRKSPYPCMVNDFLKGAFASDAVINSQLRPSIQKGIRE